MRKPHLRLEQVQLKSYLSSKVRLKKSRVGESLFAIESIKKGEIIVDYKNGPGQLISREKTDKLFDDDRDFMIQIEDDLFFAAVKNKELEDADFINHSCDPNCGIKSSLKIIAMRDIISGEEITIDYAMCESSVYKINCKCASKNCRKVITGDDWKNTALQIKYKNYFSNYLKKKIQFF